ncbi:MAG: hypothetical protein ACFCUM_03305 [Bacteroidales bacterium]
MAIFRTFTGSVSKLARAVNILSQYDEDTFLDFIDFEKADETKGTEFIDKIIDALRSRRVLTIEHKSFGAEKSSLHDIRKHSA